MTTLMLMRHGKSDWDASFATDAERPLAPRGVEAAGAMGRLLTAVGRQPDLVVSSPAIRAASTAQLAKEAGSWSAPLEIDPRLYGAAADDVAAILPELPDDAETVLMVGHQPTWGNLVTLLIGGGWMRVPTGAVACIEFGAASWSATGPGRGELQFLIPPAAVAS